MAITYGVRIVILDDECNNSVNSIEVEDGLSQEQARKSFEQVKKELCKGDWNEELKGVNFVYVTAEPFDEDYNYLGGLVPDYQSKYYTRKGNKWV